VTELDPRALEAALRAAISDSDASDLAKRMNGGWSAQAALERAMRDAIPEAVTAYLDAMPPPVSPELIAKLNKLASYLTEQGEYEAVDLIDTVVERLTPALAGSGEK
jgi:hypothetical protein